MFSRSNRLAVRSPVALKPNLTLKFEYRTTGDVVSFDEYTGNPIYTTEVFEAIAAVVSTKAPASLRQDIPGVTASSTYLKGYILSDLPDEVSLRMSDRVTGVMVRPSGEEVTGEFMFQSVFNSFSSEIAIVAGVPIEGFWLVSGGVG